MGRITIADQTVTFLFSLLLGVGFCLFYDFFRLFHKRHSGWWAVFLSDVLFWLLAAIVVFCFLVFKTQGQIRGYVLLGIFIGFYLTKLLVANYILNFYCIFLRLLRRLIGLIFRPFVAVFAFFLKICKKVGLFLKKLLKNLSIMLYNIRENTIKKRRRLWEHEKNEK